MSIAEITSALWRRRLLFSITLVVCMAVIIVITALVPKVYRATATVYVGTTANVTKLDTSEGEQLTRTYSALASNPNTADTVLPQLNLGLTRSQLLDKMSFTPVERTQLLDISAEDESPATAQKIANTYANTFVSTVASQVAAGNAPASVAVSQPAVVPTDAVRPKPPIYIGVGAILSLLVAAAVALARDRLDRRLRIGSRDDTVHGESVLARIPTLPEPTVGSSDGPASASLKTARIVRSDAFRVLRTNLDLAADPPARTIVITSPGAGEGKTTVAAQLALTIATDGDPVAIVDCDLRKRASWGPGMGKPPRRGGLAEYLAGNVSLRQVITSNPSIPDMKIVWAGTTVAEPGPLLRSGSLRTLIDTLRDGNDWVIIDTPPIAVGDDAMIASSLADGTVVVVDGDETTGAAFDAGLSQLRKVRARVLGVTINHAPPAELDAYRYLAEERPATARRLIRQRQSS
jgi:succinoglycan biosynthesis transport protein ExoP